MDAVSTQTEAQDASPAGLPRLNAVLAVCRQARSPGSPAAQAELARVLLSLVADSQGLTGGAAAVELSECLADAEWAPYAASAWLARTGIEVARPLIARSPALTDADLLALVTDGSSEHRLEVARRRPLSTQVAAAIVAGADVAATAALLANEAVRLPRAQMDALVTRAAREPALRPALARRGELDSVQGRRLANFVSGALRRHLSDRFGASLQQASAPAPEPDDTQIDSRRWVEKLVSVGRLTPAILLGALRRGDDSEFEAALAQLSGATPARVRAATRAPAALLPALLREAGVDRAADATFVRLAEFRSGAPKARV